MQNCKELSDASQKCLKNSLFRAHPEYQTGIPPGTGTAQAADSEGVGKKRTSHAVHSAKALLPKTEFDKL